MRDVHTCKKNNKPSVSEHVALTRRMNKKIPNKIKQCCFILILLELSQLRNNRLFWFKCIGCVKRKKSERKTSHGTSYARSAVDCIDYVWKCRTKLAD